MGTSGGFRGAGWGGNVLAGRPKIWAGENENLYPPLASTITLQIQAVAQCIHSRQTVANSAMLSGRGRKRRSRHLSQVGSESERLYSATSGGVISPYGDARGRDSKQRCLECHLVLIPTPPLTVWMMPSSLALQAGMIIEEACESTGWAVSAQVSGTGYLEHFTWTLRTQSDSNGDPSQSPGR